MPSRQVYCRLLLVAIACLASARSSAQDFEDEESPYRPGLIATLKSGDIQLQQLHETLAFDWRNTAPDARLPADAFSVTWNGRLWTQSPGAHRLHVYLQGEVALSLAGKQVIAGAAAQPQWLSSEPIELEFGYHELSVQFTKRGEQARIALYWTGPSFVLEPVPARFLFHDREATISTDYERGRVLATALRCEACHRAPGAAQSVSMPAPALDKLSGNLNREWLLQWLAGTGGEGDAEQPSDDEQVASAPPILRRMPHFKLTTNETNAIAAWLLTSKSEIIEQKETKKPEAGKAEKGKDKQPKPSAAQGERLFLTLGCLACHQHGDLGESGLFGGGDLTQIAAKRPAAYFDRWLADPASLNQHHRMPVFDLTADERKSLSLWLATPAPLSSRGRGAGGEGATAEPVGNALRGVASAGGEGANSEQGAKLVARLRCAACHQLPGKAETIEAAKPLSATSNWDKSCSQAEASDSRPWYGLSAADQTALKAYFSAAPSSPPALLSQQSTGRDLLVQLNCLACHQREGIDREINLLPARLQDKLAAVAEMHSDLAKELPAMTPPALNSVGDKLHEAALAAAIRRTGPPHRPYLLARMPRFNLTDQQLAALTAYFVSTDRIPVPSPQPPAPSPAEPAALAAAPRLVTADGFGCTSCHQVGSVKADKAPLNARGPDISMLEKRIRREWFDRWCASPARIVPRMEMPSVQVPVRGVLNDNVHDQLAAVWQILNTPGFEPPEPNPVRVLRLSGVPDRKEQPIVLHDVVKDGDKTYLFPLVIGLPNRHNILFDLETNRLAAWWLGDTARQRTKGKSWYWEMGGKSIFDSGFSDSEISILINGQERKPIRSSQFAANFWLHSHGQSYSTFLAELWFPDTDNQSERDAKLHRVHVNQHFQLEDTPSRKVENGFIRVVMLSGEGHMQKVRLRLLSPEKARETTWDAASRTLKIADSDITIRIDRPPGVAWDNDGCLLLQENSEKPDNINNGIRNVVRDYAPKGRWQATVVLDYSTELPADQFVLPPPVVNSVPVSNVAIAPGFQGQRLSLPDNIMPSAFSWNENGELLFASLKGELFKAFDTDGDSSEDTAETLADGLATPYGIFTGDDYIDVTAKQGLLRLKSLSLSRVEPDFSGFVQSARSGWGYTDDYHDWAVGLVRGEGGEYYLGLPCQQDKRSEAAAKHRGQILKLVPRKEVPNDPRLFDIEVLSSGHRFPMGMARNRAGDLFVTDNQGNYNPFNELNHVRPGKHFGFINANEKEAGFKAPPVEEPAINIPHPWTRSVNGICFLDTPEGLRGKGDHFGPLEGHLIGCEYDTRRLIRMTLQKIGDTYQGAAYPLSIPPEDVEKGLLGPIVCAVSPRGELYVGEIRDSGWGAGNNVGQIVKIKIEPDKLPCGIAEMRATKTGFTLEFFQPVDPKKAAVAANYSLQSYRRESTPAYGGPDLDRRTEKVTAIEVSKDGKRVTLSLAEMRTGFVYELRLKNLAPGNAFFHPDEAHFTLRQIPE